MPRKRGDYSGVYERIQDAFDIDDLSEEAIAAYLTEGKIGRHQIKYGSSKSGAQRYQTSAGISSRGLSNIQRFAQDVSQAGILYKDAQNAEDTDTLEQIKSQAIGVKVHQSTLNSFVDERLGELQQEETRFIQIQEQVEEFQSEVERIKSLPLDEQKELFRSGNAEERRFASVALREERPQVLGGLITGGRRRDQKLITQAFNEVFG